MHSCTRLGRKLSTRTATDLGTLPGAAAAHAYASNDAGQIVGDSGDRAFLCDPAIVWCS
jgi:hypothetical protein